MSTNSSNRSEQILGLAKAIGVILGVPLALFAVINSIIAQPTIALIAALVTAVIASIWVVSSRWTGITEMVIAWLSLIVIVLAGFTVWPRTMTVEGFIREAAGNPISNEEIVFFDHSGRRYETKTDAEGYYQFKDVPTGKYTVRFRESEVEGETRGLLVRVVQQNITAPQRSPTSSPILTPTTPFSPTSTVTIALSPEPSERLEIAKSWPSMVSDTFGTNDIGWPTDPLDGPAVKGSRTITDGKYLWDLEAILETSWVWYTPTIDPVSDFFLTVEVKEVKFSGDGYIDYGLVFLRQGSSKMYNFRISSNRSFSFMRLYEDEWSNLIDWTQSALIRPGDVSRLTVISEGSHFYFFINDTYVGDTEDDLIERGNVGLLVGFQNIGDEGVVEFDNFEIRRKP